MVDDGVLHMVVCICRKVSVWKKNQGRATQNTSQEKEMKTRIELKEIKKEIEGMKKKKKK